MATDVPLGAFRLGEELARVAMDCQHRARTSAKRRKTESGSEEEDRFVSVCLAERLQLAGDVMV